MTNFAYKNYYNKQKKEGNKLQLSILYVIKPLEVLSPNSIILKKFHTKPNVAKNS